MQHRVRGIHLVFVLAGFNVAQALARVPSIKVQVDASTGRLGLALLAMGIGSVLAMPWTGGLAQRFGSAAVVRASAPLACAAWAGIGFVQDPAELTVLLFVAGMGVGVWDVAMNVQGHTQEKRDHRVLMPGLHAGWSIGGVIGAFAGAGAAALGVPLEVQLPVAAALAAGIVLTATRTFADDSEGGAHGTTPVRDHHFDPATGDPAPAAARTRITPLELALGAMVLAGALAEGAANEWLALLVVEVRDGTEATGALAFACFNIAMVVGRLGGGWLITRYGRVRVLQAAGVLGTAGVLMVALVPAVGASLVGGVLWGLGISAVFPTGMSAAGDVPGRGARAIGVVSTIGYTGFILGSPTIGLVAYRVGLDQALLLVAAVSATIVVLAVSAHERQDSPVRPQGPRQGP